MSCAFDNLRINNIKLKMNQVFWRPVFRRSLSSTYNLVWISTQDYLFFEKLEVVGLEDPVVRQVKEGEGGLYLSQVAN